ncbi:Uncharacterised protein [Serratia ficaria]|nr:Uncharacterised protein [Serratia ficaria]CAI1542937.1 Uncharacterised protein [Serratia ficaria]CAI1892096.1 Uncharacterised protein [Serratia ficaria]CAI2430883.1 Uncharacterised protein [Serratia ficaria]VVA50484.1 hypothetical protein SERVES_04252 [Serratia ficaria]
MYSALRLSASSRNALIALDLLPGTLETLIRPVLS